MIGPTLHVVGGAIFWPELGRVLLTQRRPDKDFPFAWECPGGKVDGHETDHEALARELREEIGIEAVSISRSPMFSRAFIFEPGRRSVHWSLYRVLAYEGAPRPREGQGLGWFTAAGMGALPLTPGNAAAGPTIAAVLGGVLA